MPGTRSIFRVTVAVAVAFLFSHFLFTIKSSYSENVQSDVPKLQIQILGWTKTIEFKAEISRKVVTQARGTIANQTVDLQLQQWVHSNSLRIKLQPSARIHSPNSELLEVNEIIVLSCCGGDGRINYHPALTKTSNSGSQFLDSIELLVGTESLGEYVGIFHVSRGSNPIQCKCNLYNCTQELQQKMLDLSQLKVINATRFTGKYLKLILSNNQTVLFKPYGGKPVHQEQRFQYQDQGWGEIGNPLIQLSY
jgi:hypothetical protein